MKALIYITLGAMVIGCVWFFNLLMMAIETLV